MQQNLQLQVLPGTSFPGRHRGDVGAIDWERQRTLCVSINRNEIAWFVAQPREFRKFVALGNLERTLFICEDSGLPHFCSLGLCEQNPEQTDHGSVCPLTGNVLVEAQMYTHGWMEDEWRQGQGHAVVEKDPGWQSVTEKATLSAAFVETKRKRNCGQQKSSAKRHRSPRHKSSTQTNSTRHAAQQLKCLVSDLQMHVLSIQELSSAQFHQLILNFLSLHNVVCEVRDTFTNMIKELLPGSCTRTRNDKKEKAIGTNKFLVELERYIRKCMQQHKQINIHTMHHIARTVTQSACATHDNIRLEPQKMHILANLRSSYCPPLCPAACLYHLGRAGVKARLLFLHTCTCKKLVSRSTDSKYSTVTIYSKAYCPQPAASNTFRVESQGVYQHQDNYSAEHHRCHGKGC